MAEPTLSDSVTWHQTDEAFQFLFDVWDVDRAKSILEAKPRAVQQVEVASLRNFIGEPGQFLLMGVRIDWEKAKSDAIDLSVPIIFAHGHEKFIPIDGWHRLAKATLLNIATLPAVALSESESRKVHTYQGRKPRARRRRAV